MTATPSPLAELAALVGGEFVPGTTYGPAGIDLPDGSFIFARTAGTVHLHRPGRPLIDLGVWDAPVEGLAASYRAAVSA